MRATRIAALAALTAALVAAFGVSPAGATVTPSFSATGVATCTGTSHVTVTIQAQNPDPIHQAADVVLLVDRSGSIGSAVFENDVKNSLNTFVTNAAPTAGGNHIGIVGFSTNAQDILSLTGSEPALHTAVTGMTYPGGFTYTKDGLTAAEAMLTGPDARAAAPKVIIVETDGVWNGGSAAITAAQNPTALAASLVAGGTTIFAVGVGPGVNTSDLTAIAGGVGSRVFSAGNYAALDAALDSALTEIVPAATNLSYHVVTAPGFTLSGTPTASSGTVAASPGGFTWTQSEVNSAAGTTITISYDEQYTGSTDGAQALASTALLGYTDDAGAPQSADYSADTVDVSGCNRPPVADAGADRTVELNGSHTTNVTLDGSGSSDPDGDALSYAWSDGSTGAAPTVSLGLGTHTFTLTVTDPEGAQSTDDVTITVVDPTAPIIGHTIIGTPGNNGWYTSDVSVLFAASDDESDITSPACATTNVTSDTASAVASCSATSAGGTSSDSVTIKRDATGPTVTFGGNAGTYSLTDTVAITCTAADALSGLATPANCGGVSGAAYTFAGGLNTFTRTATDNAGNSTNGSVSFTVVVDAAGLCGLIRQWADNAGVANSLCVKIAKGNMQPFWNELAAQRGKHVPAAKADIILALSRGL